MEFWQNIIISLLSGGSIAWAIVKLYVKDVARNVLTKELEEKYTTKEKMLEERKELLEEVERRFLSIVAFREFEKRIDEHFKTTDRRFSESSGRFDKIDERFDKIDESLSHITDWLINRK